MDITIGFSLDLEITKKVKGDSILSILLKKLRFLVKACSSPFTLPRNPVMKTLNGSREAIRSLLIL